MIVKSPYSGTVHGYLCNGVFMVTPPKGKRYIGYKKTDAGVVMVYRDSYIPYIVVPLLLLALTVGAVLWSGRGVTVEYRVSFSQVPAYVDGVLYCTVTNVSDGTVVVAFTDGDNTSGAIPLFSGESLPYIEIDFIPTHIVYGGVHKFPLEVQNV